MLKNIAERAIIPIAMAITGFVIVCCILLYSVMKTDMTDDAVAYETRLADTIRRSARYAMLKSDRETLGNIIDNIGAQDGIEHVRIFNKKGLVKFSRNHEEIDSFVDKKSAGCKGCHQGNKALSTLGTMEKARQFVNDQGKDVLAITAPIYNEAACATAACHFHDSSQKVLGILDIGVSATHLNKTLTLMRNRMVMFSIMILILTIGGVMALLQRSVFLPLQEIKEFTSRANRGNLSGKLTGISGELADLASDVQSLAVRLEESEQKLVELQSNLVLPTEPIVKESG